MPKKPKKVGGATENEEIDAGEERGWPEEGVGEDDALPADDPLRDTDDDLDEGLH